MSDADRARWDARYAAAAAAGEGGAPPPDAAPDLDALHLDLLEGIALPATGRALDVACGRGDAAVRLAARGLDVDAVDVSPVALAAGRALAARVGVDVRWIEHDLDAGLPDPGPYDVVVCRRFRDPALHPALAAVLAPGGLLAVTVLSAVGAASGPFRAGPGELRAAFAGLEVLRDREGDGEALLVARRPTTPSAPLGCALR